MVAALERAGGPEVTALIDWVPDPDVARLVTSWPARIRADRAERLGLAPAPGFGSIISTYLAESRGCCGAAACPGPATPGPTRGPVAAPVPAPGPSDRRCRTAHPPAAQGRAWRP